MLRQILTHGTPAAGCKILLLDYYFYDREVDLIQGF